MRRQLFNAYNSEENFKILIAAHDKHEARRLAEEYAEDADLTLNWTISKTTLKNIDNEVYSCNYLIQDVKYDNMNDNIVLIEEEELKEFFFNLEWNRKVFFAVEKKDRYERRMVMHVEIADCVDFIEAVKAACTEYCRTEEGRNVYMHNKNDFNWEHFDMYVPNKICEKHGFRKLRFSIEADNIEFNQQLVNESDIL